MMRAEAAILRQEADRLVEGCPPLRSPEDRQAHALIAIAVIAGAVPQIERSISTPTRHGAPFDERPGCPAVMAMCPLGDTGP